MTVARLRLTVNGHTEELAGVPAPERLLDTLRWRLRLKGTKEGCRAGSCGACTVLVDGRACLSCLTLTHEVDQAAITTIEVGPEEVLVARVRGAFEQAGALQCGYCTPGFVMALAGLLRERGTFASREELLEGIGGNLCRCTGYAAIVRAVDFLRTEAP